MERSDGLIFQIESDYEASLYESLGDYKDGIDDLFGEWHSLVKEKKRQYCKESKNYNISHVTRRDIEHTVLR